VKIVLIQSKIFLGFKLLISKQAAKVLIFFEMSQIGRNFAATNENIA